MSPYTGESHSGVETTWIGLTTVYTASAECRSQYRLNGPSLVAFDPGYGLDIDPSIICAPPAMTTWWEQGRLGRANDQDNTVVSLGPMTCPKDWITVVTSVQDEISTLAMCCPSGYTLANGVENSIIGDCESHIKSGATLTFMSTREGESTSWKEATTTLDASSTIGAIAVVGWNIRATTSSSPSSTAASGTSSTSSTASSTTQSTIPSSTSTSQPTDVGQSAGLSTSTTIGVGVGVALGVIGIAALGVAIFLIRRKKAKTKKAETANTAPAYYEYPGPHSRYHEYPQHQPVHELSPGGIKLEVYDPNYNTQRPPAELHGG
ncbi:hypothetical protein AK830_g4751 [Neonectria ditissima]|uniref:Uncharacterized protein n=1 Tax=Neonectria ditissima TaxID=78410 RepID=A0A0P7BMR8_9HYPO|nr:hypothetical protein AK830_g4751 [Neonectria ditissima]